MSRSVIKLFSSSLQHVDKMMKNLKIFLLCISSGAIGFRTDSSGNEMWNRTFGCMSDDRASSVMQTRDNGHIISSYSQSHGVGYHVRMASNDSVNVNRLEHYYDAWLIRTDAKGNAHLDKKIGGTEDDVASLILQTADRGYIIAGRTRSYGRCNAWFIKLKLEQEGTLKAQAGSPTEMQIASLTPIHSIASNETHPGKTTMKSNGFEIVLGISMFLLLYIASWRYKK